MPIFNLEDEIDDAASNKKSRSPSVEEIQQQPLNVQQPQAPESQPPLPPIDRGYAWVIVAGI